jgi:acetoin utilization deacetylase AcuC-like enzyme
VSRLLMVEQRRGPGCAAPWVLDRRGRRLAGCDHDRRLEETRSGLLRHGRVRALAADASDDALERTLEELHEPGYLDALARVRSSRPVLMPAFAAPGLAPDTPVSVELVASAREGVRTAMTAAQRILDGDRFAYALCRPPGHHAGPGWLGGLCYLNNAAAAAQVLRDGGAGSIGILDLDLHYPNGTSAIVAGMQDVSLHSLHAWPVVNAPSQSAHPLTQRERLVDFTGDPTTTSYLEAVGSSLAELARSASVLILSLGYDTVIGDPHGSWSFSPAIFTSIGRLVARSRLPVCVIQEGGYDLSTLASSSHAFASGLLDGGNDE